jgi:o-succinylbenzoate synthase
MLERLETDRDPAPSARYALECAMLDLVARRDGIPLMRLLSPNAEPSVPINAALGPLDKVTPAAVATVCRAGFRVLKVKVGLRSPVEEIERLKDLSLHLCKGASLRLDANGAWTPEQAEAALLGFRDLPVESLEEPLHTPESAALVRLQANAPFPLALDEALHLNGREPDPATLPVRRMVIKPAVLGGVRRTLALASRAASAGVELVLTSVLESAAGIWSTAQLAAALPPGPAHGLATSDWLTRNLGRPPTLCNGRIQLPDCSGSGFQPEETDRL